MRPMPPTDLLESGGVTPARDMAEWLRTSFIELDGPLANSDHAHLRDASIGVLWQGAELIHHGRKILGRCELVTLTGDTWSAARKLAQVNGWFGLKPDFIISFDAGWAVEADETEFCAIAEHELYHAAQALDGYGSPRFTQDGNPKWVMRGHDVEEFVGVARRYGVAATGLTDLIHAAQQQPTASRLNISRACGTCALKAA